MKKIVLILVALVAVISIYAQGFSIQTPEGNISMTISGVEPDGKTKSGNIIDQIVAKLEVLEKEYSVKLNKLDSKRANNIIDEIYGLLALLPADANVVITSSSSTTTTTSTTSTQPNININITGNMVEEKPVTQEKPKKPAQIVEEKPSKPAPVIEEKPSTSRKLMAEKDFNDLLSRIGKESFSDDKLRVLRTAARNSKFNVSQIVRLIGAYTYSEDKIEALRISYPEVVDPQNNFKIIDAFTFSSDKEEADNIINSD